MPENSAPVLLIEDMRSLQIVYSTMLEKAGYAVSIAENAAQGAALFHENRHPLILLDLLLPDRHGLDLMKDILAQQDKTKVVVITANGSVNRAVEAMRAGAFDFLVKPFDEKRLVSSVKNAYLDMDLGLRVGRASNTLSDGFHGLVGNSKVMQDVFCKLKTLGPSTANVFFGGQSGSGKTKCATVLHHLSNRKNAAFVHVQCDAEPPEKIETIIFGDGHRDGALAQADGGTLFLDEVSVLDLSTQTRLLKFLQTSEVDAVSSQNAHKLDIRLLTSSRTSLLEAVETGQFREDLYHRLMVVPIDLPRLSDRENDVVQIASQAIKDANNRHGKSFAGLSKEAKQVFGGHSWRGNVRQLLDIVENAVVLNDSAEISVSMLPPDFLLAFSTTHAVSKHPTRRIVEHEIGQEEVSRGHLTLEKAVSILVNSDKPLDRLERLVIESAIGKYNGSVPKAARHLGLSPSTIYRKKDSWDAE